MFVINRKDIDVRLTYYSVLVYLVPWHYRKGFCIFFFVLTLHVSIIYFFFLSKEKKNQVICCYSKNVTSGQVFLFLFLFLILQNAIGCRYGRTFAFFYTIGLHVLVFTCLYRMSALSHLRWECYVSSFFL